MNAAVTVTVIIAMIVVGGWILTRLAAQQRQDISTRGKGRWQGRAPSTDPAPSPAPDAVHTGPSVGQGRRDHRDGGRGRRPTRHRVSHLGGDV
ncbi:hypothetical protein [Streptomyces lydicus]|uniref:hypothetical protein n=1 Tax=Streptomyces lydicus TaxID=47763 RepID=UPI0037989C0E